MQRVMGLGEDMTDFTNEQISAAKRRIFEVVVPKKALIKPTGDFEMRVDGFWYVFLDGDLVTIKHDNRGCTEASYRGGRMRSGSKVKKRKRKKPMQEKKNAKSNRPVE